MFVDPGTALTGIQAATGVISATHDIDSLLADSLLKQMLMPESNIQLITLISKFLDAMGQLLDDLGELVLNCGINEYILEYHGFCKLIKKYSRDLEDIKYLIETKSSSWRAFLRLDFDEVSKNLKRLKREVITEGSKLSSTSRKIRNELRHPGL
ncbi:hypothetical protein D9757_013496 [Collybiopsis confluens]|uniref:Uncharacterized protein n=1 Tax=Collybiopsis confluens TaxID=2823264 RepID=A0A8H5FT37_9AGAR|nr:hypothetical protein D9757_013496 [Collybiopsis confluens]